MQTFYMIIGKKSLSLYEKIGVSFKQIYLQGKPEYLYDINRARECIDKVFAMLIIEYNMRSIGEIDLVVINNEDKIISDVIGKLLRKHIREKIEVEDLLGIATEKLCRDKKLHISEYGINFDGKNYLYTEKGVEKNEFSLLGYTVNNDELMRYIG